MQSARDGSTSANHPPESGSDADSIFAAGVALQQGRAAGGKSWANSVCAFQHFQRASDVHHRRARLSVGVCYLHGDGVVKDVAKAFAIFKAGADEGHGEFCYRLGTCYRDAAGTPKLLKNKAVAVQLFGQAHAAGVVEATLAMVDCYATGYGVVQNKARALSMLESAAATGHAEAMHRLGKCLLEGTLAAQASADNTQDERRAFALFERAAVTGHTEAREMMAVCLESGVGIDAADAERAAAVRASAVHAQRDDP